MSGMLEYFNINYIIMKLYQYRTQINPGLTQFDFKAQETIVSRGILTCY